MCVDGNAIGLVEKWERIVVEEDSLELERLKKICTTWWKNSGRKIRWNWSAMMTSSGMLAVEKQEGDFGFLRVIYRDPLRCWNVLVLYLPKPGRRGW